MAGFRKDKTTSANTALMTAGGIVQKLVEAGVVKTTAAASKALGELFDAGFEKASPVVDADNELFEEVEKAAPATTSGSSGSKGGGRKTGGAKGGAKGGGSADPGSLVLNSGPFKGLTIADVYALDEDTAKEEYGYTRGPGSAYIDYLTTDANPNDFTRDRAASFLEQAA